MIDCALGAFGNSSTTKERFKMHMKEQKHGRRRLLLQLGSAGMALGLTLGSPAASEVVPAPAVEAHAQMPQPFPPIQYGFWDIRICLMVCYPEWALCCDQEPDPLY